MPDFLDRVRLGKQYGYEVLFKKQDPRVVGKPGIILAEMGMPEEYEFEFYSEYIHHVFHYILPFFIRPMVLADRGIVLLDPDRPLAREPFTPRRLVDGHGSFTNRAGKPYIECPFTWRPPATPKNPWDHGYFLYTAEGKGGAPDICQKTGAKVSGWYFGKLLPEKKVAWRHQFGKIYTEAVQQLKARYPQAEFRLARYTFKDSLRQAVDELLAAGCETILYQSISNPIYSDFEEYAYALPLIHAYVAKRAKVICVDQLGNQPAMREAYLQLLRDQLSALPETAKVRVILSRHGHPFKKDTQDARAHLYREPLEAGVRQILQKRSASWDVIWSCDEYADSYWDPKHTKVDTHDVYHDAIQSGIDYVIELPTEFPAENTDLMIFHAMKKFNAFAEFDRDAPVSYPDWERPLVRTFREDRTTAIYAGCPVGPYRKYVVEAVVNSVAGVLK